MSKLPVWEGEKNLPAVPQIGYSNEGRSGKVHYSQGEIAFSLDYEFGSGNCVAYLFLPSPENWEAATNLPLALREQTLQVIGHQVVKDQVSSGKGYFKIEGNWLYIYS